MALIDNFVKKELTDLEEKIGRDEEMRTAFLEESGLEGADVEYLRNSILSAEEAQVAKKEQLDDVRARKSRKTDWDEYVDAPRRWGRALHHSEIIGKLRKLIPGLLVLDGAIQGSLSLYVWDRTQPFENKTGGTVYLGWMHNGWNPEYEIDIVNDVGVAVSQKRGWRTILTRLICRRDSKTFFPKSLITEYQAAESFGYPSNGATAVNYKMNLWKFRNTSPDQAKMEYALMQAAQSHMH